MVFTQKIRNYDTLTFYCKNQTQIDIISEVDVCALGIMLTCGLGRDVKGGLRIYYTSTKLFSKLKYGESNCPCSPHCQATHILMRSSVSW